MMNGPLASRKSTDLWLLLDNARNDLVGLGDLLCDISQPANFDNQDERGDNTQMLYKNAVRAIPSVALLQFLPTYPIYKKFINEIKMKFYTCIYCTNGPCSCRRRRPHPPRGRPRPWPFGRTLLSFWSQPYPFLVQNTLDVFDC